MQSPQPRELTTLYASELATASSPHSPTLLSQVLSQMSQATSRPAVAQSPAEAAANGQAYARFFQSNDLLELLKLWVGDEQLRRCATSLDGADWLKDQIERDAAAVQELIENQLNAILHCPAFQKLEASWRGLDFLIRTKEKYSNSHIQIRVLNCRWSELSKTFENSVEWDQNQLFKKVYEEGLGQAGESPYSALILDYAIHPRLDANHRFDDLTILRQVGEVAAAAFCPVIANAHPSLLGVDQFSDLKHSVDFDALHSGKEFFAWQQFRKNEHSRFVALALPNMLMRQPYREVLCHNFLFTEQTTRTEDYLWGGAAFAVGEVIMKSFAENGWYANMRGASYGSADGGLVLGPTHISYDTETRELAPRPLTDFVIDDTFEHKLANAGFLPLCALKNSSLGAFYSSFTCQTAKSYTTTDATMSAKLSTMLNYMLCASRFAHYLKNIARDKVGGCQSAEELEDLLQRWIEAYISNDRDASPESRARKPLYEAQIQVTANSGNPGEYNSTFLIVPHYELDDMKVSISLNSKLIAPTR